MQRLINKLSLRGPWKSMTALLVITASAAYSQTPSNPQETTGCGVPRRGEILRSLQKQVLQSVPLKLDSLEDATKRGGQLEGWRLSHGHVVLAGAGSVAVDNPNMRRPCHESCFMLRLHQVRRPIGSTSMVPMVLTNLLDGPISHPTSLVQAPRRCPAYARMSGLSMKRDGTLLMVECC
jgi:hypothetical protein